MDREAAQKEILALATELNDHSRRYYVEGRPVISDLEYDRLYDRLAKLEEEYPDLRLDWSPTLRVGSDLSQDLEESPHQLPVLSLDKAYTPAEVRDWAQKTVKNAQEDLVVTLEEKLDGTSIVLYYVNGVLDRALTRGNGFVGNVVTANVKTIRSVPLRLPEPLTLAVRGEIFLKKSTFEKVNRTLPEPYSNPRNLAAGTLRRVVSSEVAKIPLDLVVYEGFFDPPLTSHLQVRDRLKALGFPLSPRFRAFTSGTGTSSRVEPLSALEEALEEFRILRPGLDYEIDGLVLKVDSLKVRDRLGMTGHHPRWAVAFKFESPQAQTWVEAIDVQVGRTGRITPVARVKPVALGGAVISNVTLHNQDYIDSLELGVGDQVTISRRGDVIPAVEEVVEKVSEHIWTMRPDCPACGSLLIKDGAHHFCPSWDCPDQVRGRLNFFAGKDQMDLTGLGPETMEVLLVQGLVKDVPDLFTCDLDRLLGLPGFGDKKVQALKDGLAKAKERDFPQVLSSLGIPELGKKAAELLVEHGIHTWEALTDLAARPDEMTSLPGFGEKTATVLHRELLKPQTQDMVRRLKEAGLNFSLKGQVGPSSREWEGQSWCVTGSFADFNPRSKAEALIKDRGARVVSAVSGSTTHLLAGEGAGSKLSKAQSLGVKVVTEEEFKALLGL